MFFIQSFDFTFQGIIYCGIPFPVHSQMSLSLAILAQTQRTVLSSTSLSIYSFGVPYHFHFTEFSAREVSGGRGLWIFCIFLVLYNLQTWLTIEHIHIMNNCVWKDNILYNLTILINFLKIFKEIFFLIYFSLLFFFHS